MSLIKIISRYCHSVMEKKLFGNRSTIRRTDELEYTDNLLGILNNQYNDLTHEAREQAHWISLLLQTTEDSIIALDEEGLGLFCNEPALKLLGIDNLPSIICKPVSSMFRLEATGNRQHTDPMQQALKQGIKTKLEEALLSLSDSRRIRAEVTIEPLFAGGQIKGVLVIIRKHNRAAGKPAGSVEIDQFIGGISHDFNNLLTIIRGNLELLQEDIADINKDDPAIDVIEDTLSAVDDGIRLVDRLAHMSKIKTAPPASLIHTSELLSDWERTVRCASDDSISITFDIEKNLPLLNVDGKTLTDVLSNLVLNARDAMPEVGKLCIIAKSVFVKSVGDKNFTGQNEPAPGQYIMIMIADNGRGISAKEQSLIFEPFYTTKSKKYGHGLGLNLVKRFADLTGAYIQVESEPGSGTNIYLYLPVPADATPIPDDSDPATDECPRGIETVLVVEDEKRMLKIALHSLSKLGYQVIGVDNVPEAIDVLSGKNQVDLVFSDIVMPGEQDGLYLASWTSRHRPALPVLLTTGHEITKVSFPNQPLPILAKPYSRQSLACKVRELLDGIPA